MVTYIRFQVPWLVSLSLNIFMAISNIPLSFSSLFCLKGCFSSKGTLCCHIPDESKEDFSIRIFINLALFLFSTKLSCFACNKAWAMTAITWTFCVTRGHVLYHGWSLKVFMKRWLFCIHWVALHSFLCLRQENPPGLNHTGQEVVRAWGIFLNLSQLKKKKSIIYNLILCVTGYPSREILLLLGQ